MSTQPKAVRPVRGRPFDEIFIGRKRRGNRARIGERQSRVTEQKPLPACPRCGDSNVEFRGIRATYIPSARHCERQAEGAAHPEMQVCVSRMRHEFSVTKDQEI